MTRLRWFVWILLTVGCVLVAWCGRPAARPLVPAAGLSSQVRFAAVMARPERLWSELNESALIDGLFTYDELQAAGELSAAARSADLPPLAPPARLNPEVRLKAARALSWLQPTQAALVQVDRHDQTETWLGLQGARIQLLATLAKPFTDRCVCGDSIWLRLDVQPVRWQWRSAAGNWQWPRNGRADVEAVLPHGLPQPIAGASTGAEGTTGVAGTASSDLPPRGATLARLNAVLDAAGLPGDCERLEGALNAVGGRLNWRLRYRGSPPSRLRRVGPESAPWIPPALPRPDQAGVFLTLQADIDWQPLYRGWVAALDEEDRADFMRSMRWYRMVEKGYEDPERQMLAPLGRGLAVVGRRGLRYNGKEWMPSVQAELPLKPPPTGLLHLVRVTPNETFRCMMPDFAAARFDKIRRVGESSYSVHPPYVAVTLGSLFDRYVMIRPTIAGSALMMAWQVDERRVKFGTRPEILDAAPLFPALPQHGGLAGVLTRNPQLALYFDPAAITDQLDHFRILVKVEAGSDRPKPETGLTVERIAAENERVVAATRKNMRLAAQVGWVLQRIGPVSVTVEAMAEGTGYAAEMQGTLELKAR